MDRSLRPVVDVSGRAGTTAAAIDGPVGRIDDKSGNGNHAVQASAAARPTLRQDGNGKYYLEFDGADDTLVSAFALSAAFERFSALRQVGWAEVKHLLSGASEDARLYQAGASPRLAMFVSADGPATTALGVGVNAVVTERFAGAGSRLAIDNGAYASATLGDANAGGVRIGSHVANILFGSLRLYGLVVRAGVGLSDSEIGRLRAFLAAKAGVAL